MFACLLFGDSLALGVAEAVNARFPPHCEIRAVQGAASAAMLDWSPLARRYDTAILSIGSNDDIGPREPTSAHPDRRRRTDRRSRVMSSITLLRGRLPGTRVIWLLPYDRPRAVLVRSIAAGFGDEILDMARFRTKDGVHPASYGEVAAALLK